MHISENQTENDQRSTAELIQLALGADPEEDGYWKPVQTLHRRASAEVLDAALELCRSSRSNERELGVDILAQLGVPTRTFPEECNTAFISMLNVETEPNVLTSLGHAVGHHGDPRAIGSVIGLKDHPDSGVRESVAFALLTFEDPRAISTLIQLSSDSVTAIRDWATFGLGSQIDTDTPEIREALLHRVTDEDDTTRGEAFVGLAVRHDPRVVEPLIRELSSNSVGSLAVEAAKEIADPRLRSVLEELRSWWDVDPESLEEAIEASRIRNP